MFCGRLSLPIVRIVIGLAHECKMPFSNNYQEALEKKKNRGVLLTRPGNYTAYLGPHNKVTDREKEHAVLGLRVGG